MAPPTAFRVFQEDSHSLSSAEEVSYCGAGYPCCTSRGTGQASPLLPSARDGCSGMKVGAHPGLSFRAGSLLPRGLCAAAGTLLHARVSAQPARGAPHGAVGIGCGWKERCSAGQGWVLLLRGCCVCQDKVGIDVKRRSFPGSVFNFLLGEG